ncbi:hypothetical protein [Ciceribacter selenitireducens]
MRYRFLLPVMTVFACLGFGAHSQDKVPDWVATGWEEPQDTRMALLSPDEYAWRLFVALNWPAKEGTREAAGDKKLGDPGRVTWESWMLVSGGPLKSQVYRKDGVEPLAWTAPLDAYCDATARDPFPLQNLAISNSNPTILFEPGVTAGRDEVRMNKDSLGTVVDNMLYNVEGQEALFDQGLTAVKFRENSKEIKAQWREIDPKDETKFHSCHYNGKIYGLTALHIITKDLPNWFWATFEHIDNKRENFNTPGYAPWLLPSRDSFSCPSDNLSCEAFPKNIGLEGTRWEHYRLRGTQVDFVDATGEPTRLANSQVETSFQTTSSCITCHARATIGAKAETSPLPNRLNILDQPFAVDQVLTPFGAPDPNQFVTNTGGVMPLKRVLQYTQLDFVWSVMRAQRRPK